MNLIKSLRDQFILRGARARLAHHDPQPCLIPPDWSMGCTSILALQQEEAEQLVERRASRRRLFHCFDVATPLRGERSAVALRLATPRSETSRSSGAG